MSRAWVGIVLVLGLVALAIVASARPDWFPSNLDVPRLVYLLMALLLVSGAGYGFYRFRHEGARAAVGLAIWAALILAIVAAYSLLN
jgi:hypothetical protein